MKKSSKTLLLLFFTVSILNNALAQSADPSTELFWNYKTILAIIVGVVFSIGFVMYQKEKRENDAKNREQA